MELHERRGDPIPEGWGCDPLGKITTDPKRVLTGGGLVPVGGSEATGQKQQILSRMFSFFMCEICVWLLAFLSLYN